jgi:hypothetical protein
MPFQAAEVSSTQRFGHTLFSKIFELPLVLFSEIRRSVEVELFKLSTAAGAGRAVSRNQLLQISGSADHQGIFTTTDQIPCRIKLFGCLKPFCCGDGILCLTYQLQQLARLSSVIDVLSCAGGKAACLHPHGRNTQSQQQESAKTLQQPHEFPGRDHRKRTCELLGHINPA